MINETLIPKVGVVTDIRKDTPDVKTFRVVGTDGKKLFQHMPGQCAMVSIPGVFTPSEAATAHRYGADFVKLFPNSEVAVSYLKALTVPLGHIKFLAVGGVTAENMQDYLNAGAKGIGVATAIADKTAIRAGDFEEITRRAKEFTCQL